jgi:rhomboid-like protein
MITLLGKENFCALYLTSGIFASLFSVLYKTARLSTSMTVGASGCILGVVSAFAMYNPNAKLSIILLPFFSFSAEQALCGIVAFDLAGLLFKWRVIDHAAHLGGAAFGLLFSLFGHQYLYSKREHVIKYWKQIAGK